MNCLISEERQRKSYIIIGRVTMETPFFYGLVIYKLAHTQIPSDLFRIFGSSIVPQTLRNIIGDDDGDII